MRDILDYIDEWTREGEQVAVATVVAASGSTPRPVGAKLVVTKSGRMQGSVSGGCVEGAVFQTALEVIDSQTPQLVSFGITDEMGWEVGLSCGGEIEVYVEPVRAGAKRMDTTIYSALRDAIESQTPAAIAKIVAGPGLGSELLLVFPDERHGTLGAPDIDAETGETLRSMLRDGGSALIESGERRVFLEAHLPPPHLVVIGAVHIAMPLVAFGRTLGFRTTVIDARGHFATAERFPDVDALIEAWPDEALRTLKLHPGVAAVCLAHDPKFEDPAMEVLLRSEVGYIGAIGSRATSGERRERLAAAGFSDAELDRIHGPVGINIGSKTPEEIALAIMAEIIAVRRGRDPRQALAPARTTA